MSDIFVAYLFGGEFDGDIIELCEDLPEIYMNSNKDTGTVWVTKEPQLSKPPEKSRYVKRDNGKKHEAIYDFSAD